MANQVSCVITYPKHLLFQIAANPQSYETHKDTARFYPRYTKETGRRIAHDCPGGATLTIRIACDMWSYFVNAGENMAAETRMAVG